MSLVLDSSAVLALLDEEPGAEVVRPILDAALVSAVNHAEVVTKLTERDVPAQAVRSTLEELKLAVIPLDAHLAEEAGFLRAATRAAGLSLGDRACLALARSLGVPAYTTDRSWRGLDIGVEIRLIRGGG